MTPIYILILGVLGVLAGTLGALLGLGGSLFLVPALTFMGYPVSTAVASGLVCVVATSMSASGVYLRSGWTDARVAQPLQVATVLGAATGAWFAPLLPPQGVKIFFAAFLVYAAWLLWMGPARTEEAGGDPIPSYAARNLGLGMGVCYGVGGVSGILGIGGGPIQVPLLHLAMDLPVKAATATSSYIMGITATTAAVLYLSRGDLLVTLTAPLAVGVVLGAQAGSRLARHVHSRTLQRIFVAVLIGLALLLLRNVGASS